jgi:hypothetical protein
MRWSRTGRALRADAAYLLVLLVMAGGFAYLSLRPTHWLRGVVVLGCAAAGAGIVRLVLPERHAGLLAVRGRLFDAICYLGLGVLVVTFAILTPR